MWRNTFKHTLIQNYNALKIVYKKNNQPFHLKIPAKLNTNKELMTFSSEITKTIALPEYHYLTHKPTNKSRQDYSCYD